MTFADIFDAPEPRLAVAYSADGRLTLEEAGHRYTHDGEEWPSVTRLMRDRLIVDATWYSEQGALRGSYVHRAVQLALLGRLDWFTLDRRLTPYVRAALAALRILGAVTVDVEGLIYSKRMRVAGRYDWLGYIGRRDHLAFIDWTTLATPRATPSNLEAKSFQMAGYREIILDMDGTLVVDRYTIALYSDGDYNVFRHRTPGDGQRFRAEARAWWKENAA